MTKRNKRQVLREVKDLSLLPEGQIGAVVTLVGDNEARTYIEASKNAGTSVDTLYTHLRRIRNDHPKSCTRRCVRNRKAQLRTRHREALARAREHAK